MTEEEQLKKAAHDQYVKERFGELDTYINGLFAKADMKNKETLKWQWVMVFCLYLNLASLVFFQSIVFIHFITDLAFNVVFLYCIFAKLYSLRGTIGEIEGTIKTLEILGFIEPRSGYRKRLPMLNPFRGLVELWEKTKRLAQDKVYGTA